MISPKKGHLHLQFDEAERQFYVLISEIKLTKPKFLRNPSSSLYNEQTKLLLKHFSYFSSKYLATQENRIKNNFGRVKGYWENDPFTVIRFGRKLMKSRRFDGVKVSVAINNGS